MATEWFYGDDNEEQQGPITLAVLREKYASGEIRGDTLLWNEDMDTWEEFDALQEVRVGAGMGWGVVLSCNSITNS